MTLSGVVLAGGASRRMGRDKASLAVGGETMLERQVRVLRESGASPVYVAGRTAVPNGTIPLEDAPETRGPVAGLLSALRAASTSHVAALAVDMPMIRPGWFIALQRHCSAGVGIVCRVGMRFEPLAAIYPISAGERLGLFVEKGGRTLQAWLADEVAGGTMRAVMVREGAPALRNCNTAEEWERWLTPSSGPAAPSEPI